jgi:hypothetical protein
VPVRAPKVAEATPEDLARAQAEVATAQNEKRFAAQQARIRAGQQAPLPPATAYLSRGDPRGLIATDPHRGQSVAGAVAQSLKETDQAIASAIRAVSRPASQVAGLDPAVFGDALKVAAGQLPVFGKALSAGTDAAQGFFRALDRTADRLAPFSAALSQAQAEAELAALEGNIRRADLLGEDLAKFVEARSKLSETAQDALAALLKPLIPIATDILEWLIRAVDFVMADLPNIIIDNTNGIIRALNEVLDHLPLVGENTIPLLDRIAKNTKPKEEEGKFTGEDLLDALRARTRAAIGGAGVPDAAARFPALEGF